ncbi:hypothetical protein [Paraburkholderia sp. BR10882]
MSGIGQRTLSIFDRLTDRELIFDLKRSGGQEPARLKAGSSKREIDSQPELQAYCDRCVRALAELDANEAELESGRGEGTMEVSFRLIALQAEAGLRALSRQHVNDCIVTALEPTLTWFLIRTKTDAERDLLTGNQTLLTEFKEVFRVRGCSDALIDALMFTFESQETVDRQYAGDWYWALK